MLAFTKHQFKMFGFITHSPSKKTCYFQTTVTFRNTPLLDMVVGVVSFVGV